MKWKKVPIIPFASFNEIKIPSLLFMFLITLFEYLTYKMTAFFSIWLAQSAYNLEMWPTHKMQYEECELNSEYRPKRLDYKNYNILSRLRST